MNKITKVNLKNYLLLLFLFVGFGSFAQNIPTYEWNKDGRSTTDKGNLPNSPNPITSATVTFYKNTDNPSGQTFIATNVTATIELIQPYSSSYKNAFGLGYEAIGGSGNGYRPVAREIYSKQGGSAYTASPNVNSGTGISANDNYSLRTFFPIYPLFGQSSTGRFLIEKVKVTFSEPVDNPVFHIAGIGAYMESTGDGADRRRKTYFSEWELADESLDLSVLSGDGAFGEFVTSNNKKGFTNNTVRNRTTYSTSNARAAGSVVVYGTGLTEVVFNVYMTSKINQPWNINLSSDVNKQLRVGEVISLGVSFDAPCGVRDQKPVVNSIRNTCPSETVNLNDAHTGTIPSGAELLWFTSATRDAGTQVSNPEAVEEGSYYAFYYDGDNDCWSPPSLAVTVTIDDCPVDPCAVLSVDLEPYNRQTNTAQIFADNVIGIGSARMTISHPFGSERLTTDRIYESLGVDGLNYRHAGAANSFDERIETQISFSTPVKDLSFVIDDLDQGDRLRVLAYDQNNVLIPLTSANYEFYPNTIVTYNPAEGVTGEFSSTNEEISDTRGTINFNFNGKQVSRVLFQYYDTLGGGIYIITKFSGIDGTDCPDCTNSGETSVNLNDLFTGTLPHPTVVLEWWTSPNRDLDALNPGTKVDDPTNVTESGTYYVFFYDTVNDCYNTDNSTSFVNVNILPPCDINTCVTGDCNPNTFINAVDPNTLEYDNMVSVFHSSIVREADGTIRIWGQGAMPNGYSNNSSTGSVGNVLTPIEVSPANGYNYSGKILRFTAGSNQYNQQFAILTTDGLYSWGDQGVLLHADLQPRGVFTKLEVGTYGIAGTKADGLPVGVNPEDVKMLFGMRNGMAIVTCTGEAWVLSNITELYGDGITSGSENKVWHRVSTAANTPLENVVAIRGAYRNMVALTASGELYTWGYSTLLGDGSANAARTYATLMTKPAGVTPKMIGMTRSVSSAGGGMSYYLLATDGKLYSMGANDKRQLGNGTTTSTTTWGEVTATDAATGATLGGNIVWLSSQEHDGNEAYPAVSVLTDQGKLWAWGTNDGNMLGIPEGDHTGNNPTYMPGRTTGAYDETKLNESDEVIAVETGGHTSIIIKKCTIKFGYVGHRINGSMADGTTDAANEGIYNFSETSQLAVCGALTSPKIPELLEICPDEVQDLTAVQTILPAEVTGIHWYHDINAAVPVSNPSEVGPGTYYAFYELAGGTIHDCPSRLVVSYYAANDPNSPCYCVEPGIPGEPDGYTLTGVSDLVGFNEGWPTNVPNGFIAIESKTQGFVITRVAHVGGGTDGAPATSDAISNPVEGMLVYDIQDDCVKLFNGTTWNCLSRTCNDPVFRLDCSNVTTTGDTHGPDVNFTITVPYFNGGGSTYETQIMNSIQFGELGLLGMTATLEGGTLANGNGNLTITVTGTVVNGGPAYFELMVNGDKCVVIIGITFPAAEV